jgi:hypothetical protein
VTKAEALTFVHTHGVALESATGPMPSLAAAIAGGSIRGSWWGHARSHEIFRLTRAVRDCPDVLVCRIVDGKITYVHRRVWPALVCVSERFPASTLRGFMRSTLLPAGTSATRFPIPTGSLGSSLPKPVNLTSRVRL